MQILSALLCSLLVLWAKVLPGMPSNIDQISDDSSVAENGQYRFVSTRLSFQDIDQNSNEQGDWSSKSSRSRRNVQTIQNVTRTRQLVKITNCVSSSSENLLTIKVECDHVTISQVAKELPENITSLAFRKCSAPQNLTNPVLSHLKQLRELSVRSCGVSNVEPAFLESLNTLRELKLENNNIRKFASGTFSKVPNVWHLSLRNNNLVYLKDVLAEISKLGSLKKLDLGGNSGIERLLADDFKTLENGSLEMLSFSKCGISVVEEGAMRSLNRLNFLVLDTNPINRNALRNITKNLLAVEHLQLRNLSSVFAANSVFITEELRPLTSTNISHLDLSENVILRLRDYAFPKLVRLKVLKLSRCHLEFIAPNAFRELIRLEELYLVHNKLSDVFFQLPSLNVLDVSSNFARNKIKDTFDLTNNGYNTFGSLQRFTLRKSDYQGPVTKATFSGMVNLQILEISNTALNNISAFSFSELGLLKQLILPYNYLQVLGPSTFIGLNNLTHLILSHNIIESISDNEVFKPLTSLEFLSLQDNMISVLPDNIFYYNTQLESLILSDNLVTSWSYNIFSNSSSLHVLLLRNNFITDVTPSMLTTMQRLDSLDFSDNPFICNTCNMKRFQKWILNASHTIKNQNFSSDLYSCSDNASRNMTIFSVIIPEELCTTEISQTKIGGIILAIIASLSVLFAIALFIRKFRHKIIDQISKLRNRQMPYQEFNVSLTKDTSEADVF